MENLNVFTTGNEEFNYIEFLIALHCVGAKGVLILICLNMHSQEEENLKHEVAIKHQNALMNYQRQLSRKDNQIVFNR